MISRSSRGFTLIEVLIAMLIMAGGVMVIANSWSGNVNRVTKARLNNTMALLLQQKMTEIEIQYQDKDMSEVKEEESGDFGADHPGYSWSMKSKEMEFPDLSGALVAREGGADELLLTMIRQMSEFIKQSVKEISVTVSYKDKRSKKEISHTATTYFVDYKKDIPLGPGGGMPADGGAPDAGGGGPNGGPAGGGPVGGGGGGGSQ